MKEQRLNFSDYSAEEQERDAERHTYLQKKYQPHAFLLKVSGTWAHITFDGGEMQHKFYDGKNLYQMFNEIKQTHPQTAPEYPESVETKGPESIFSGVKRGKNHPKPPKKATPTLCRVGKSAGLRSLPPSPLPPKF